MSGLDSKSAEDFIFASYMRARPWLRRPDEGVRRPHLTDVLLRRLGRPQQGLPSVLVAGSKGKGSTAAFAAALLATGGEKVGLFTSPHLLDIRERIRVGGRSIPPDDFVRLVEQVAPVAKALEAELEQDEYLSPIGLLLAVAMLHFREAGVEWAVVEAGRGARFDDTVLVEHPVAAITPILAEHRRELGPSLARIAWHKAGAIPEGGTTVSAPQRPVALEVLRAEASKRQSRLLVVGEQIGRARRPGGGVVLRTPGRAYPELRPGPRGPHQADNLALAVAAVEALWTGLLKVPAAQIQLAVSRTVWPGRCETLQESPLVLVDGAIDATSARSFLAAALPLSHPPVVAVVGVPADKDYPGLLRVIGSRVERLYVTRARNPHLRFPDDAARVAAEYSPLVQERPTLEIAVEAALGQLGADGTLWIVGTQSLVADALRLWGRDLEYLSGLGAS